MIQRNHTVQTVESNQLAISFDQSVHRFETPSRLTAMNESIPLIKCVTLNGSDEGFTNFEFSFYIGCGAVGGALNVLTLLIALTGIDTHDKPRQLLVINMTIADLLMCLVYMATRPYLNLFPIPLCYPYYVTICSVAMISCVYLLWLNVDKLLFLQFPLRYYTIVNRRRLILLCTITWIVVVGFSMAAYYFMAYVTEPARCDRVALPAIIYTPICILYVLIITISFGISFSILLIAQNSSRVERGTRSRIFHRLFFLFSSTLWTFFTCLPYRMLYLGNIIYRQLVDNYCPSLTIKLATDIFFRLLVLGTVINPTITIVTQRAYRQQFNRYLNRTVRIVCRHQCDERVDDRKYSSGRSATNISRMAVERVGMLDAKEQAS